MISFAVCLEARVWDIWLFPPNKCYLLWKYIFTFRKVGPMFADAIHVLFNVKFILCVAFGGGWGAVAQYRSRHSYRGYAFVIIVLERWGLKAVTAIDTMKKAMLAYTRTTFISLSMCIRAVYAHFYSITYKVSAYFKSNEKISIYLSIYIYTYIRNVYISTLWKQCLTWSSLCCSVWEWVTDRNNDSPMGVAQIYKVFTTYYITKEQLVCLSF